MSFTLKLSEQEFNQVLEDIDSLMASQGANIPGRDVRGWMLFCQGQQLNGISMNHPISEKVTGWFKAKYGERLNLEGSFGNSALVLRDDILRFRCPVFWGRLLVFCSPDLLGHHFGHLKVNQPVPLNMLGQIHGFTTAYAHSLTAIEQGALLEQFVESEVALADVADAEPQPYIAEAQADIRTSVEQMTMHQLQFGPSKWSSLQATEKFLKSYIIQKHSQHKNVHILKDLAENAESLGLRVLERGTLDLIQCPPAVRYDASSISKTEAVAAHKAAISICADIARQLPNRSGWKTSILFKTTLDFPGKIGDIPAAQLTRVK